MTDEELLRAWIDAASYEELLTRWRHAPVGDPIFRAGVGDYYARVMKRRREEVGCDEHVRISKRIGYDKRPNP
ncbi:MAG: hypothetical protein GWO24_01540 [Akkermansiaceae bacterium]|nr:hypothetical protein [Akkermansiaceae bacterium]NIS10975.1 hypothetical protein [Thermoplasmata archaeon]NIS18919.1 hypothetical protein [Thermoplasmata archaeon]NIT75950.1 hypothetical protein [Thermoplasmata archaeon]NIY02321.1 hypothetical protein [Thermoplasmata archaeon]